MEQECKIPGQTGKDGEDPRGVCVCRPQVVPSEELVKALQLLQSVLSPEDFSNYEVKLVPPKQQERVKLRERELLEAVERQANYEKQEQKHLEMVAKHEHNLAQQKAMLESVRAQLAAERWRNQKKGPHAVGQKAVCCAAASRARQSGQVGVRRRYPSPEAKRRRQGGQAQPRGRRAQLRATGKKKAKHKR